MNFTIYGLRRCGSTEFRYVGLTSLPSAARLARLLQIARGKSALQLLSADFRDWLNGDHVEIVSLRAVEGKTAAHLAEREEANSAIQRGDRLFNRSLIARARKDAA